MRKHLVNTLMICSALFISSTTRAEDGKVELPAVEKSVTPSTEVQPDKDDLTEQIQRVISSLPKISGYLQTGYNWGDKNGDNRSSFQMKRMRVFVDKKISNVFDFRTQLECFSTSVDGTPYNKKVITIMDAFVTAHVNEKLHFRAGQYYLPLGFENYDISPATLETVDFSNICYRMVCRNAVSTPNLIDYGRDIGVMAYGDLLKNEEKGFNYLSYNLSLTNGYVASLNDDNKSKDFVGRITVRPIKDLRIMGSYNWGEYKGLNESGQTESYLPMNRFIAGAWYSDPCGLNLRAEYGYIKSSEANVKETGFYLLASYNVGKFTPVARWDMYRDKVNEVSANNRDAFLAGCTYGFMKNIKFQLNYIYSVYPDKVKDFGTKTGSGNSLQIMCLANF